MSSELIPFLIGAFLLLYALLGNFSRQSRLIPVRPNVLRSGSTILGVALVAVGIYSGTREDTPPSAAVAAVAQQPTKPQTAPSVPKDTPTPAATPQQPTIETHRGTPKPSAANVEVHDMPLMTAKPQKVTVRELPDSVAKEIIKHLPVPHEGN